MAFWKVIVKVAFPAVRFGRNDLDFGLWRHSLSTRERFAFQASFTSPTTIITVRESRLSCSPFYTRPTPSVGYRKFRFKNVGETARHRCHDAVQLYSCSYSDGSHRGHSDPSAAAGTPTLSCPYRYFDGSRWRRQRHCVSVTPRCDFKA